MHVTVSLNGTGMSFPPGTPTTYDINAGQFVDVQVLFTPTAPGQSPGSITVQSDDPCHLSETFAFCGIVFHRNVRSSLASLKQLLAAMVAEAGGSDNAFEQHWVRRDENSTPFAIQKLGSHNPATSQAAHAQKLEARVGIGRFRARFRP
jgi:hypothetical protein